MLSPDKPHIQLACSHLMIVILCNGDGCIGQALYKGSNCIRSGGICACDRPHTFCNKNENYVVYDATFSINKAVSGFTTRLDQVNPNTVPLIIPVIMTGLFPNHIHRNDCENCFGETIL